MDCPEQPAADWTAPGRIAADTSPPRDIPHHHRSASTAAGAPEDHGGVCPATQVGPDQKLARGRTVRTAGQGQRPSEHPGECRELIATSPGCRARARNSREHGPRHNPSSCPRRVRPRCGRRRCSRGGVPHSRTQDLHPERDRGFASGERFFSRRGSEAVEEEGLQACRRPPRPPLRSFPSARYGPRAGPPSPPRRARVRRWPARQGRHLDVDGMLRLWHDGITGWLPVTSADLCDWCRFSPR